MPLERVINHSVLKFDGEGDIVAVALVFISWILIFISSFLWGAGFLILLRKAGFYIVCTAEGIILCGLCALTVYAECFSLFHGLGRGAICIVIILDVVLLILFRGKLLSIFELLKSDKKYLWKICIVVAIAIPVLILTNTQVTNYDSSLYHEQAIHWIEDYGVIKGLGNLHHRFAYNSSFLCLQALFSLKFLTGVSLHSLNGFMYVIMVAYAILSQGLVRKRKVVPSDFFKASIIIFCNYNPTISSPGTDFMPMSVMLYIFSKWIELSEEDIEDSFRVDSYSFLALLAIWGLTLKLSVAVLPLLAIYPFVIFLKKHSYKKLLLCTLLAFLIVCPFLIRNVLISGYLLYPYPGIDLFDVDWKMNPYTVLCEKYEIQSFARGLHDQRAFLMELSFREWIPSWLAEIPGFYKAMLLVNLVGIPFCSAKAIRDALRRKGIDKSVALLATVASILLWFVAAPGIRFGSALLLMVPCFILSECMDRKNVQQEIILSTMIISLLAYHMYPLVHEACNQSVISLKPYDYDWVDCRETTLNGQTFYFPMADTDLTGYHCFPAVCSYNILEVIELRGDSLRDGIRLKEECRNRFVNTNGVITQESIYK